MSGADRPFEACDLIEVMEEAVRYNRFLQETLRRWSEPLDRILDFGAGNGRFVRDLHGAGRAVEALEPDPALRARIAEAGIPARASLDELAEGSFSGVYSINVLEHVAEDGEVLRRLAALLRPGGALLLYVPAFEVLFSANDRRVGHLRRYRRPGLRRLVEGAGFEVESARYVDCLGFPAGLWYRAFGDDGGWLDPRAVRLYDRLVFPVSRALDRLTGGVVGKNLLLTARKPGVA